MKYLLFAVSLFLFVPSFVDGQDDTSRPIVQFLLKRGYVFPDSIGKRHSTDTSHKWPDTLYYNTEYKAKRMGSITIPYFFSSIEIAHGNITVSPAVNLGLGYTWFGGDFIFDENDKIIVDPKLFYGVFANTGLENGLSLKRGGLYAAGFVGVSSFTLIFGYDIINKSPSIGVGGRIDFYSISQNFLHVLGKVHSVRKHKRIDPPITRE